MQITDEHVKLAFWKLKRYVYYDKTDLLLRMRLADFECSENMQESFSNIADLLSNPESSSQNDFEEWCGKISCRITPKQVAETSNADDQNTFISNVSTANSYDVTGVNYFFDGLIELHLIAILWVMLIGKYLDKSLGKECYGSRLHPHVFRDDDTSANLFKKYHDQYASWRDEGIQKAKRLLVEDKQSVFILGMDLEKYFYHVDLDFTEIANQINPESSIELSILYGLNEKLKIIHESYSNNITEDLKITHPKVSSLSCIPIGLCSSPILANWYLKGFDESVKRLIRPAYYGRYIDDILLVITSNGEYTKGKEPIKDLMDVLFVKNEILSYEEFANEDKFEKKYITLSPKGLILQQEKCILQYFDAQHSIAALEKFKKKLDENASNFLLLPVDESDSTIEDVAYDLLYDGSVNKFRSVKGMAENRFELAIHLARQTILHLQTDQAYNPNISAALIKFFKGRNSIVFYELWERVFTYFFVCGDTKSYEAFDRCIEKEINRTQVLSDQKTDQTISEKLRKNLFRHKKLAHCMTQALGSITQLGDATMNNRDTLNIRNANLIRNHFVRVSLLNYTTFSGDFTKALKKDDASFQIDKSMLTWSPRFVHLSECLSLMYNLFPEMEKQDTYFRSVELYNKMNHFNDRQSLFFDWSNSGEEDIDEL